MKNPNITPENYTEEYDTTHSVEFTTEELRFLIILCKYEEFKKEIKSEHHLKIDTLRAKIIKLYGEHINFKGMDEMIKKFKL